MWKQAVVLDILLLLRGPVQHQDVAVVVVGEWLLFEKLFRDPFQFMLYSIDVRLLLSLALQLQMDLSLVELDPRLPEII